MPSRCLTAVRSMASLVFLPLALTACGNNAQTDSSSSSTAEAGSSLVTSQPVEIFAAASMNAVGDELIAAYTAENPGADITVTYAGSSQLVTQMTEGATPDILLTADTTTMGKAIEQVQELTAASTEIIATNSLVLATAPGNPASIDEVGDLAEAGITTAICAAEVPCGRLAAIELTRAGITPSTATEEANVSTVATKISTGEVDAGFIYSTDAIAIQKSQDITVIDLPEAERNSYPLALTATGKANPTAGDFANWLANSKTATQILTDYGFSPA